MEQIFSHLDGDGNARMVDVGGKENTLRCAAAQALVTMQPATLEAILVHGLSKGDVFACARLAGITAAKRTADLIPLCHPIPLDSVEVSLEPLGENRVRIISRVRTVWRTGVEMEAMTAASAAALTVYDMCKGIDRGMEVGPVVLLEKSGGRSGHFVRDAQADGGGHA